MSTFQLTPFDSIEAPLLVEADEHAVEGLFHVFRRTALVMGHPRPVVVRRVPAALVARVEIVAVPG